MVQGVRCEGRVVRKWVKGANFCEGFLRGQ